MMRIAVTNGDKFANTDDQNAIVNDYDDDNDDESSHILELFNYKVQKMQS